MAMILLKLYEAMNINVVDGCAPAENPYYPGMQDIKEVLDVIVELTERLNHGG